MHIQLTHPTSSPLLTGELSLPTGEDSALVLGAEDAVDQGIGAGVGAGEQEQDLLDPAVQLGKRLGISPEPESDSGK